MNEKELTAVEASLISCHSCGKLFKKKDVPKGYRARCSRCHAVLHQRKQNSIARTWALLITALVLYVPSNICPITTNKVLMGGSESHTIISNVIILCENDMWAIGILLFSASILVPMTKIMTLIFLLLSIELNWHWLPKQRTILYRLVEKIGRWSMVDVFVVSILIVLLKFGIFLDTKPEIGVVAFAGVVIITMFAAISFDPRIIWDNKRIMDRKEINCK